MPLLSMAMLVNCRWLSLPTSFTSKKSSHADFSEGEFQAPARDGRLQIEGVRFLVNAVGGEGYGLVDKSRGKDRPTGLSGDRRHPH